ncbi:PREDICTED: interleukin-15 isoform X2 [Odobenus rosmarus divergens]|uniref:Interleukin n=1 Tax=Odobenus rosmarus divergens TaxID=9708 RepID=A0A2U3WC26_ODORO|nr:PREDICTED: interleukin-15 isoform X2 [Odobenus rosmarus divergens]
MTLSSVFLTNAFMVWGTRDVCSCISAGLPKTEATWQFVISDLEKIDNIIQSIHIDTTLYTESDAHPSCKVTAMKCFLLELRVILLESKHHLLNETVENLIILANDGLSSNGNVTETGCKECEELEEKNIKEFFRSFVHIVQMFINSS